MAQPELSDDSMEQLRRCQLLSMEDLHRGGIDQLFSKFCSAREIFAASEGALRSVGKLKSATIAAILRNDNEIAATQTLARMQEMGVRILAAVDDEFPESLRTIPSNPPLLMMHGTYEALDKAAVAIVGSRRCSHYGQRIAQKLATELAARGYTIVSGLARGIDAAAHRGALSAGGRTIAVLASGLANLYPPEHVELATEVRQSGAIFSEAPLDGAPIGKLFPRRNRIISGLSLGVVVVEAANRSGTLSTANHALEQDRQVFAVPGRVGDLTSEGTNRLIRDGAHPVTCVEDILECLGPAPIGSTVNRQSANHSPVDKPAPVFQSEMERSIYSHLTEDPIDLDQLIENSGLPSHQINASLVMMELRRLVRRHPGNRFSRA